MNKILIYDNKIIWKSQFFRFTFIYLNLYMFLELNNISYLEFHFSNTSHLIVENLTKFSEPEDI